jgi:DNA-binding response OmpR family regulator
MDEQSTILIVDDEPAGREALEGVFFSQGYKLLFAENGQQAYDRALEGTPDVILLDVMMPNMDGFEVCRKMRAHPLLQEVPILIVTALDDRDSRLKGIEAGADDFITKPFDRVELRARVRTITRLNRYRRLLLEKARFAWVVEQASEGYLILDENDCILYANQSVRTLLGLPQGEDALSDQPFQQFVEKSFRCEPESAWQTWRDDNAYEPLPIYLIQPETPTSQPIWLELRTLRLPGSANRNRLLRISQVNEQINSLLGMWNFHSFLTHKLRTPVSNLTFGAEILLQHHDRLPAEEVTEILRGMQASSKRLEREIDDILKFVHTPAMTQGQQNIRLGDLPDRAAEIAVEMNVVDISVTMEETISANAHLGFSAPALETVLTELFENSKKFHPQLSPRIEISVCAKEAGMVLITVKDDGVCLSPYQLANMFTPYFQAEKYFTGEIDGMGLGLATVAALVWGANGECRLSNRTDQDGIQVDILLPYSEPKNVQEFVKVNARPGK